MPLFRKHGAVTPREPSRSAATTDWSDVEAVKAEWAKQTFDLAEDSLGFRNGMRLANDNPVPMQQLNCAEYMSRGLKHSLMGTDIVPESDVVIAIDKVLWLLEDAPTMGGFSDELRLMLVRLVLTIAKVRGWQPSEFNGSGRISARLDTPLVLEALRCDPIPPSDTLGHFFQP